jgi:hypothetical protein
MKTIHSMAEIEGSPRNKDGFHTLHITGFGTCGHEGNYLTRLDRPPCLTYPAGVPADIMRFL